VDRVVENLNVRQQFQQCRLVFQIRLELRDDFSELFGAGGQFGSNGRSNIRRRRLFFSGIHATRRTHNQDTKNSDGHDYSLR
jgi:hypothetical protein